MVAGLVCDNYKVEAYKKALTDNKFMFTVGPGVTDDTTTIKVQYEKWQLEGLAMLIKEVEKLVKK